MISFEEWSAPALAYHICEPGICDSKNEVHTMQWSCTHLHGMSSHHEILQ